MELSIVLLFSFLTIFTSCNGQEKTNILEDSNASRPGLALIRNFKTRAMASDFDTTLVSQYIQSIFQDSKGNLWFGNTGEGLVKYDVKTFTNFSRPDAFYCT
jgi:recombinational DNA repair ATPase RecF